jgi:SAM-dependent methyltransferase
MDTRQSYDGLAEQYARLFCDEMDTKPFDREMLKHLAAEAGGLGVICDLGCGPGQIARYLHRQGFAAYGIDLSGAMVAEAQRLNPDIPFRQGNMLDLTEVAGDSFGGVAAFYSIIHISRADVGTALREIKRVLRPGGVLLLAFHTGQEDMHLDEWWEKEISLDFYFYLPDEMEGFLCEAGYENVEIFERPPYSEIEYQSRRVYIFARKPV